MQSKILHILKLLIPLGLGLFLIYFDLSKLSDQERSEIWLSMQSANMSWVALSLLIALLSHVVRAYRWNFLTKPLGFSFTFPHAFFSVMIGYFVNLAVPRLGEVMRCTTAAKLGKQDFTKIFGTVIVERLFDLFVMALLISWLVLSQWHILNSFITGLLSDVSAQKNTASGTWVIFSLVILGVSIFWFIRKSNHPWAKKIINLLAGFWTGIQSILQMKNKMAFVAYTLLIWLLYILALYTCFLSIEDLHVSFGMALTCFVVGGISMALTQGGLGLYPLAIMQGMVLYGVSPSVGRSVGWLMWSTHTGFIIFMGIISLILASIYQPQKTEQ